MRILVYTATEVTKTGPHGESWPRKLDALTGRVLWERACSCGGCPRL
ncbi:hypothetical protein [Archangium sp.]|nr:hypothetical protein [Archangium sp.]